MMEKKMQNGVEYLNQISKAEERVRKLEVRVRNLRTLVTDNAHHMNRPTGHGQVDYDRTGTLMAEICDAERELSEARNAATAIREEVGRTITRIDNEDAQDVIFMRYGKGMKWEEIAAAKMFSIQRVYQLRKSGIEEVERMVHFNGFVKKL